MASAEPTRIPLPMSDVFARLHLPSPPQMAAPVASLAATPQRMIEDFTPVAEGFEARLAGTYWENSGLLPFLDNEVPFLINNDGRLSERAAAVFFAYCSEVPDVPEAFQVLEIGAGTGLFAKYFLDAFRLICDDEKRDFYSRMTYIATDRSRRTVEQWDERGLFEAHAGHVVLATMPAGSGDARALDGGPVRMDAVRFTACNYVLDVLPATIVRGTAAAPEELFVRTHLTSDDSVLGQYTRLNYEQIRDLAARRDPAAISALVPLLTAFEFETAFHGITREIPYLEEALAFGQGLDRVLLNYGAFAAVEQLLDRVTPLGYVLINDYGPTRRDQVAQHSVLQRFGSSIAYGIDFPLLEHFSTARNIRATAPDGDDDRSIHSRLLSRVEMPGTREVFAGLFSAANQARGEEPVERARAHVAAGRFNEALKAYNEALAISPRCWQLIGEAGEFVSLHLRDFASGLDLLRVAAGLNPWYSTWLWNALGDTLYCLERYEDAHEAYLQAARINPRDVRTNLNIAYTYLYFNQHRDALEAIGRGLADDVQGAYRSRLLEKQQQILAVLSARREGEHGRALRRTVRFQNVESHFVEPRSRTGGPAIPTPGSATAEAGAARLRERSYEAFSHCAVGGELDRATALHGAVHPRQNRCHSPSRGKPSGTSG